VIVFAVRRLSLFAAGRQAPPRRLWLRIGTFAIKGMLAGPAASGTLAATASGWLAK
jgi:hypothetical protein